jgi:hypothetical protein
MLLIHDFQSRAQDLFISTYLEECLHFATSTKARPLTRLRGYRNANVDCSASGLKVYLKEQIDTKYGKLLTRRTHHFTTHNYF